MVDDAAAPSAPSSPASDANDSPLSSFEGDDASSYRGSDHSEGVSKPFKKKIKTTITPCHCLSTASSNWQARVAGAKPVSMIIAMQLLLESQGIGA